MDHGNGPSWLLASGWVWPMGAPGEGQGQESDVSVFKPLLPLCGEAPHPQCYSSSQGNLHMMLLAVLLPLSSASWCHLFCR